MKKSSQATLFIALGIIVLLFTVFLVWLGSPNIEKYLGITRGDDKNALKTAFDGCLAEMATEWLFVHGMHTGNYGLDSATFGLNDSDKDMPDLELTKRQLESFLKEHLDICIEKSQGLHGFNITKKNPDFDVVFTDSLVIIRYSDLYLAEKADSAIASGHGSIEVKQRTRFVIEHADEIIDMRVRDKYIKDSPSLQQEGFTIEVARDESYLEHWLITDNSNPYDPYYFAFLVQIDK
ncbi:hypothetical protein JXB31_03670 [Candidatus Woesearchaeota archaeon]|nr:hypothetical protein [Candidatus Woesearchaeota archaeon]